jgi:hypothetical protein
MILTTVAVCGEQRMAVNIDRNLFPPEDIFQNLGEFIQEELLALQKGESGAPKRRKEEV